MSIFPDKRVFLTFLLIFAVGGIFIAASGYSIAGLLGEFSLKLVPYFYCIETLTILLTVQACSKLIEKNPQLFGRWFFIFSIIIVIINYILILFGVHWAIFTACIILPTVAIQSFIFSQNTISLTFDIREYRRYSPNFIAVSAMAGFFFSLSFPGLIYLFKKEILIIFSLILYMACLLLSERLKPIHPHFKQSDKPAETTMPMFFRPLLTYSIVILAAVVLMDYLLLRMLQKTFDKNMIGVVSTLLGGALFGLQILIQLRGQKGIITRFGLTSPFILAPCTIILLAVIAFIFPSFVTILLAFGLSTLVCQGPLAYAYRTILNTISIERRFRARAIISTIPYVVGKSGIAAGILFLLGKRYATFHNVLPIVIIFAISLFFLVVSIREGYKINLKNQVEKIRFAFANSLYNPVEFGSEEIVIISEIGRKCPLYSAALFFKNSNDDAVSHLIQDLDKTKDIVNIQARIKLLGQLSSKKVEGAFMELVNNNSELVQNAMAEAIAIRALTFEFSSSFKNFIADALHSEGKKVASFWQILHMELPEHLRLEVKSRHQFALERFLYLFAAMCNTRAVLNSIPKIQNQIFVKSNQLAFANAIEYLDALSENHQLRALLQETFEPSDSLMSKEEFEKFMAKDPWLSRILNLKNFISGVNMNIEEKILFLRKVDLFQSISAEALELMAGSLVESAVKAKQTIFLKGDDADRMYMLVSGAVEIKNDEMLLSEVKPFGLFGEISLLDNQPRSGTALAKTDVVLYSFYKQEFNQLLEDIPALSKSVIHQILAYLRNLLSKNLATD